MIFFEVSHAVFETIGGSTFSKWRPNFEKPAQNQTITISSLAATIMSTNGKNAKKISAGRYCSPRAAMKSTLSRRPRMTSSAMTGTIAAVGTSPLLSPPISGAWSIPWMWTPGSASETTRAPSSATYSSTSTGVRSSPAVNGTLPGHGGIRIVRGRA